MHKIRWLSAATPFSEMEKVSAFCKFDITLADVQSRLSACAAGAAATRVLSFKP